MSAEFDATAVFNDSMQQEINMSTHAAQSTFPSTQTTFRRKAANRVQALVRGGGSMYAAVYSVRFLVNACLKSMDRWLVAMEQKRSLAEPWCISAQRWTATENKQQWNTYDWSRRGEEWTKSEHWKAEVIARFLEPYMPQQGVLLEIGPGGGRWTEVLQRRAKTLYVVDVSEKAIQLCKDRFADCSNIVFKLGNGSTIDLTDASIDAVWSYDVFVHITPVDVRTYFRELRRILKRGGRAVIHHAGAPLAGGRERAGWRSDLTVQMVLRFANENGLRLLDQTQDLVNAGDYLSIFEKSEDA